jgi:trans-aconitate 2-methyltransferase
VARCHDRRRASRRHLHLGDTATAADRLRYLAELFEPPTRDLLCRWAPRNPEHAVDLGCGPGHSTQLVHEVTGARWTTGVDGSAAYVAQATGDAVDGVTFVEHDVTEIPLPVRPADLVFARYLLTHLSDPAGAVRGWASTLRPGGRPIVQETAGMTTTDPALGRYYELVADLQRHHGQDFTIGSRLRRLAAGSGLSVVHDAVRLFRPPVRAMARLHALNLRTWRTDAYARAAFDAGELDDLSQRLSQLAATAAPDATVDHTLGELVLEA